MPPTPHIELRRPTPPRYHLGRTFSGLKMGQFDPTLRLSHRSLRMARRTPDGGVTLRVDQEVDNVRVRAWGDGAAWMLARIDPMLGFHDDPVAFRPEGRVVRALARKFEGMHLPRLPHVYDRLNQIVLLQLVSSREAIGAWSRIVRALGEPAPGPGGLMLPPDPRALARTPAHDLIARGVGPRQARTLRLVAHEASRIERAASRGDEALGRFLTGIPGIGAWSAGYLHGSALGAADAVLPGDYNLPNVVSWALAGEPRGNDPRMLELLEPYRGHRFRVIRLLWAGGVHAPRRGPRRALRQPHPRAAP